MDWGFPHCQLEIYGEEVNLAYERVVNLAPVCALCSLVCAPRSCVYLLDGKESLGVHEFPLVEVLSFLALLPSPLVLFPILYHLEPCSFLNWNMMATLIHNHLYWNLLNFCQVYPFQRNDFYC